MDTFRDRDEGLESDTETTPLRSKDRSKYFSDSSLYREMRRKSRTKCCAFTTGLIITTAAITLMISQGLQGNGPQTPVSPLVPAEDQTERNLMSSIRTPEYVENGHNKTYVNESTVAEALRLCDQALKDREALIQQTSQNHTPLSTAESLFMIFKETSKEAEVLSEIATCNSIATHSIVEMLQLTKEDLLKGIIAANASEANQYCKPNPKINCDSDAPYRAADGSCNNLDEPYWGVPLQPFRRLVSPDYGDGISDLRTASDGAALPNVRRTSESVFQNFMKNDSELSMMFVQWGQFVAHDLSNIGLTAGLVAKNFSCCNAGKTPVKRPECISITISDKDEFYSRPSVPRTCMPMVRSAAYPSCSFGPREQYNERTAYMDASSVYGSDLNSTIGLRGNPSWKLKTSRNVNGETIPPQDPNFIHLCSKADENAIGHRCFEGGDARINEYFGLTSMHLIWLRHHNRLAQELHYLNPHWDDEHVFQEARRILIAQVQHITFNEFLPYVIGPDLMKKNGLELLDSGYSTDYDKTLAVTTSNSFSTAAFRFGHSMLQGKIKMMSNNGDFNTTRLSKLLFNPFLLYRGNGMDQILNGMAGMAASKVDTYFTHEMTRHMFQKMNRSSGFDIGSVNLQRGRDHGLAPYSLYRQACGLSNVSSFKDLYALWPESVVELVKKIYRVPEDIDLFLGGIAEMQVTGGGIVGPTFACIIADQFERVKKGDRFWYESGSQPKPFTPDQLKSIRRITLSRILCENGDNIVHVQPRVLFQVSKDNEVVRCASKLIPNVDYGYWKEERDRDSEEDTTRWFKG